MSTINTTASDTSLIRHGLEPLDGLPAVDRLRGRDDGPGAVDGGLEAFRDVGPDGAAAPLADAGEDVLNAAAWMGVDEGDRLLAGDAGFEASLGAMDLSQAADSAAEAVFDALF